MMAEEASSDTAPASEEARLARRAQKDLIFEIALEHAPFDGWSQRTLRAAADEAGVPRRDAARLFPNGGASLLEWLDDWLDRRAQAALVGRGLEAMPVKKRVAVILRARLEALSGRREAMRRAAAAAVAPGVALGRVAGPWAVADWAWRLAGFPPEADQGVSRYTRRGLLAGVWAATFLFWLEDRSDGAEATWRFMERRLSDAMRLGKSAGQFTSFFARFGHRGGRGPAGRGAV